MHVFEAIASRRSIRGFLDREVSRETIEDLLATAARAPSGGNIQPWKVHILEGAALRRVADAIHAARTAGPLEPDYVYYPTEWREPWISRKRKVGWDLYERAGVQRGDRAAGEAFHARNFDFFGAPVGVLLTIERDAGEGAWVDLGIFAGTLMLAARGLGLDTCPQAFFAEVAPPIRESLPLPDNELVVCGIAVGYADPRSALNGLVTEREPVAGFCTFHS
jgi:nitroreductase